MCKNRPRPLDLFGVGDHPSGILSVTAPHVTETPRKEAFDPTGVRDHDLDLWRWRFFVTKSRNNWRIGDEVNEMLPSVSVGHFELEDRLIELNWSTYINESCGTNKYPSRSAAYARIYYGDKTNEKETRGPSESEEAPPCPRLIEPPSISRTQRTQNSLTCATASWLRCYFLTVARLFSKHV